ncbi:MAG: hypothetical protein KJ767_00405, partial [Nanoarchaeota archaeon]|nr:hypothetical protein [Nanoarchaeota archaeon]
NTYRTARGKNYRIEFIDTPAFRTLEGGAYAYGVCEFTRKIIGIAAKNSLEYVARGFVHEILHADSDPFKEFKIFGLRFKKPSKINKKREEQKVENILMEKYPQLPTEFRTLETFNKKDIDFPHLSLLLLSKPQ